MLSAAPFAMSNVVATITHGLFWSVATVACAAVYTVTMVPFVWRTRKLGVGLFEKKDRSALYPKLFTEDGEFTHHRYIDLGGGKKFHVVESGNTSGPLVLFLHGFPQCWYTWSKQLEGLKDDQYHLVAMDMRGYGASYRPKRNGFVMKEFISDVRGVIEALQKDKPQESRRVTLVSHDWGAIVGWHVMADSWKLEASQQGYIDKGIIINIGHPLIGAGNLLRPFQKYLSLHWLTQLITKPAVTWPIIKADFAPVLTQLAKSYYIYIFQLPTPFGRSFLSIRDWFFAELVVKGIKNSTAEDAEIYKAAAAYATVDDPTPAIDYAIEYYRRGAAQEGWSLKKKDDGFIGIPVLVLWGEQDVALDMKINLENTKTRVPNVEIQTYPGVGHFLPEEIPDELNEKIRRFAST
ncbi:Alpha/Beta hydrolase protein [Umbelopsis sp. AD052]|nr:Alpha/Beta hydrolase protein [Umbelopsis sp. AD052]